MFNVSVKCPYCQKSNMENWEEYIENSETIDDREMGAEVEHEIYCEEYVCSHCDRVFKVEGSIYEYPEGAFNDSSLSGEKIDDDEEEEEE